jgi:flagellar biosynthesis protein FlhG
VGTVQDILSGKFTAEQVILRTQSGFDLLPAASGGIETVTLGSQSAQGFIDLIEQIESDYDVILFDAGAGIGEIVLFFVRLSHEIILVVTPEPTSMMDAYATIKVLALRYGFKDIRLIVNLADPSSPELSGMKIANHLQSVVSKFLPALCGAPVRLHHAGSLPLDPSVSRAIKQQKLLLELDPTNPVSIVFPQVADSLQRNSW